MLLLDPGLKGWNPFQVTMDMLDVLWKSTWANIPATPTRRFIVAGANNPFGRRGPAGLVEDVEGQVLKHLRGMGACVPCDWVANSGTAQLFHRGLFVVELVS